MLIVNHHAGCCGFQPIRPDGTEWSHVFALPGGGSIHADTPGEVLAALLPGYAGLDAADALAARTRHAHEAAAFAQEALIADAARRGDLDDSTPDGAALAAILRHDRATPIHLAAPGSADPVPWAGALPLVLVTTTYAPHSAAAAPTGHVRWLDPTAEQHYLDSLRAAGAADYWRDPLSPSPTPAEHAAGA